MKQGDLVYTYEYIITDPYDYYNSNNHTMVYGIILDLGRDWDDDYCDAPPQMYRVLWSTGKIMWHSKHDFIQVSSPFRFC
jgi:hypothetical protein